MLTFFFILRFFIYFVVSKVFSWYCFMLFGFLFCCFWGIWCHWCILMLLNFFYVSDIFWCYLDIWSYSDILVFLRYFYASEIYYREILMLPRYFDVLRYIVVSRNRIWQFIDTIFCKSRGKLNNSFYFFQKYWHISDHFYKFRDN